ncbi:MAG: hypothetical protein AAF206_06460 [Bacteroidota bacterium]
MQSDIQIRQKSILIADWQQAGSVELSAQLRRSGFDVEILASPEAYHDLPDGQIYSMLILEPDSLDVSQIGALVQSESQLAYEAILDFLPAVERSRSQGLNQLNGTIDLEYLLQLDDDPEFILEMLQSFQIQAQEGISVIQSAMVFCDWEAIRTTSHRLRYPFASIGRQDVFDHLGAIENNAKQEQSLNLLSHQYPLLVQATGESLDSVKCEINQIRNGYL